MRTIIRAIIALFFVIVIAVPLLYFPWSNYPFLIPKTVLFQSAVEIIFFLWLVLAVRDRRYRPRMTPLLWSLAAYCAILTVTALTGIDPWRSFFSTDERMFGVVALYHLAAMALVASALWHELPWKKLWYASLGTSAVAAFFGILQVFFKGFLFSGVDTARVGSTFGNPAFLAGYLLFNIFLAGYYLFALASIAFAGRRRALEGALLWAVMILDAAGVFFTQTRGDILGLAAGILALFAFFTARPPREAPWRFLRNRAFYATLLGVVFVAGAGIWFTQSNPFWAQIPGLNRLNSNDIGPRLMVFKSAWQGFLERPILGWGAENFGVAFNKYYDPHLLEFGYDQTNFDKPHNVPLEELVSGGVGLFLAYAAIIFFLVRAAVRAEDRLLGAIVISAVAAYVVRDLVVFDTIGPTLILYLLIGFIDGLSSRTAMSDAASVAAAPAGPRGSPRPLIAAALIAAAILIYSLNLTTFFAASRVLVAHEEIIVNDTAGAAADFRGAMDIHSPYSWRIALDYGNTLAQAYFYDRASVAPDDLRDALARMQQAVAKHPNDAYNHYLLANAYNLSAELDPRAYLPLAESEGLRALALGPERQQTLFFLAKTKNLEGDNAAAITFAKQAVDLDPNVADAHFYYGMLAFANGDMATGYAEVSRSIAMGRAWLDVYEPRLAADYYADSGHLQEAIGLYHTALGIKPDDLESEIKLGAAYFLSGDKADARRNLLLAAPRFDFGTSPQYAQYKRIFDAMGITVGTDGGSPHPPLP